MNIVALDQESNTPITTSLIVADNTGVQHKNVMEMIRRNLDDLNQLGEVAFKTLPLDTAGGQQQRVVAILSEPQATLLLTFMRNSPIVRSFKVRLVKAFFELKGRVLNETLPPAQELSRLEILQMAIESEQKLIKTKQENEALNQKISLDAPKVEFFEAVAAKGDLLYVSDVGKLLGIGRNNMFDWLRKLEWITVRRKPMQSAIDKGYLDYKYGSYRVDGVLKVDTTTMVTPYGLYVLREMLQLVGKD